MEKKTSLLAHDDVIISSCITGKQAVVPWWLFSQNLKDINCDYSSHQPPYFPVAACSTVTVVTLFMATFHGTHITKFGAYLSTPNQNCFQRQSWEEEKCKDSFISLEQVTEVVKTLPSGKTPGMDESRPEVLKALDIVGLPWLTRRCSVV